MNKYIVFFILLFQAFHSFTQTYEEIKVLHKNETDGSKKAYYAILLLLDQNTDQKVILEKEVESASKKTELGKAVKSVRFIMKGVVSNGELPKLSDIRHAKTIMKQNGFYDICDNLDICEAYVMAANKDFAAASIKYDQIYDGIKNKYLKRKKEFLPNQNYNLITMSIAFHYFSVGEHEKAVEYIDDLVQFTDIKDHPNDYAVVMNNAGTAFLSNKQYVKALEYYDVAQKILVKNNVKDQIGWNTFCISLAKLRQGKNEEALKLINSIEYKNTPEGVEYNNVEWELVELSRAEILLEENNLTTCDKVLNRILAYKNSRALTGRDWSTAYNLKYLLEKKQANYKLALTYHEKWVKNQADISREKNKDNFNLQIKFLNLEKNRIKDSFQKKALKREKELQYNNQLKMIAVLIAGILIIGIFLIRYIRASRRLADLNNENHVYTTKIANSLSEKEVMLKEIHHRVKNNFQIISSLLNLQANSLENSAHINPLIEAKNRIYSMSLIHQKMYSDNANYISINFKTYLEELLETLHGSYGGDKISLNKVFNIETVDITLEKAVPIGLFCNEVFTNAYKYAVSADNKLTLHVSLKKMGEKAILHIRDEGPGVDYNKVKSTTSIGQQLKEILSQQVDGELKEYNQNGAVVELEFLL